MFAPVLLIKELDPIENLIELTAVLGRDLNHGTDILEELRGLRIFQACSLENLGRLLELTPATPKLLVFELLRVGGFEGTHDAGPSPGDATDGIREACEGVSLKKTPALLRRRREIGGEVAGSDDVAPLLHEGGLQLLAAQVETTFVRSTTIMDNGVSGVVGTTRMAVPRAALWILSGGADGIWPIWKGNA